MWNYSLRSITMHTIKPAIVSVCVLIMAGVSCGGAKSVKYLARPIPVNSGIAVIIEAPNKVKNVVLSRFLERGFNVKAINASDFYSINDVFDIRDFKKVSYIGQDENFLSLEKTYNNLYKMNFYNYEVNKVEILGEMRNKWNVQYLILIALNDMGGAWGRAIDLRTNDIVWIDNRGVSFQTAAGIVDSFIDSMTGKK